MGGLPSSVSSSSAFTDTALGRSRSVITQSASASSITYCTRSSGYSTSIGMYAAPAFNTAIMETIRSAVRCINNTTLPPSRTPRF